MDALTSVRPAPQAYGQFLYASIALAHLVCDFNQCLRALQRHVVHRPAPIVGRIDHAMKRNPIAHSCNRIVPSRWRRARLDDKLRRGKNAWDSRMVPGDAGGRSNQCSGEPVGARALRSGVRFF